MLHRCFSILDAQQQHLVDDIDYHVDFLQVHVVLNSVSASCPFIPILGFSVNLTISQYFSSGVF